MSKRRASAVGARQSRSHHDPASGLFQTALKQHHAGSLDEAELLYRNVIAQNPNHAFALSNLGVLLRRKHKLGEAIALYRRAIQADPNIASTHNNLGNALVERGLFAAAQNAFRQALELQPDYPEAAMGLVRTLVQEGETEQAVLALRQILKKDPHSLVALEMLGRLLVQRREHDAAIPYLLRTIELQPKHVGTLNNLGCVHSDRGDKRQALEYFRRAAQADPTCAPCQLNIGNMLRDLEGAQAALPHYRRAVELDAKYVKAWFNLGSALSRIDPGASIASLQNVLALQSDHIGALVACLMSAEKSCNFASTADLQHRLNTALSTHLDACEDWNILGNILYNSIFQPIAQNLACRSRDRIDGLLSAMTQRQGRLDALEPPKSQEFSRKIRLGYLSPNFRDHPVGHVTLSLFAKHDRSRFEVHAFSTSSSDLSTDPYQVRHRQGVDVFHSIGELTARDAAMAIRNAGIDILVDLDGFMDNKSPPILAFRPAHIQMFWLGHAGGLGLAGVDYLVADKTVIPPGEEPLYREHILRLADVYHCADRPPIASECPSRVEFGLPESGFVYCAFNNPQKIDRVAFECWMRILKRVDGSCLWLLDPDKNAAMVNNLRRNALEAGIDPSRLVFASRVADKTVHLARHRHAGLFLDTLTLNASTTGLDALWAGLPLLTLAGARFASRIASTMLGGVALGEMIAKDLTEYEERAVSYALEPELLSNVKHRLAAARNTQPLFDTERFARQLEQAFARVWESYVRGELAQGFDLASDAP